MGKFEVLVLNGSPGVGKSTIASAISDILEKDNIAHAVIDFDELGRVYPENADIKWMNLTSVCANYMKVPNLDKLIIPIAIDSEEVLSRLKGCLPGAEWIVCELVADREVLLKRVTEREPDEYWREKLRDLVNRYADRDEVLKFGELKIKTDPGSVHDTAKEVIQKIKWSKK